MRAELVKRKCQRRCQNGDSRSRNLRWEYRTACFCL